MPSSDLPSSSRRLPSSNLPPKAARQRDNQQCCQCWPCRFQLGLPIVSDCCKLSGRCSQHHVGLDIVDLISVVELVAAAHCVIAFLPGEKHDDLSVIHHFSDERVRQRRRLGGDGGRLFFGGGGAQDRGSNALVIGSRDLSSSSFSSSSSGSASAGARPRCAGSGRSVCANAASRRFTAVLPRRADYARNERAAEHPTTLQRRQLHLPPARYKVSRTRVSVARAPTLSRRIVTSSSAAAGIWVKTWSRNERTCA